MLLKLCNQYNVPTFEEIANTVGPEKIISTFEPEPMHANSSAIRNYVPAKRLREFPDFLSSVPDGHYHTTARFSLFCWERPEGETVTLLLAEVTNGTNNYWVGSWDLTWRSYGISLKNGVEFTPKWVIPIPWTSSSVRDQLVINCPAYTPLVVHSGIAHWCKRPTLRYFFMKWCESE